MNDIQNLLGTDWAVFITAFFMLLFGVKEIIEIINYFKNKFNIKTSLDDTQARLSRLERHDRWQYEQINKICQGIENIQKNQKEKEIEDKKRIILQFGAELYNFRDKFKEQGYITRAGAETFSQIADVYLEAGGNHLIKEQIIPEVMQLPLKE